VRGRALEQPWVQGECVSVLWGGWRPCVCSGRVWNVILFGRFFSLFLGRRDLFLYMYMCIYLLFFFRCVFIFFFDLVSSKESIIFSLFYEKIFLMSIILINN
jgi:hypothetical protein